MLQRLADRAARAERVVHDQRQVVFLRQRGERLEIRHREPGIADRLEVDRLGLRIDQRLEARHLHAVGKPRLDADVLEGVFELIVGPAVEVRRRDEIVAHRRDVVDRQKLRRVPRRRREGRHAAFERRDAFFENVGRRIHQPCVDVAELLEGEQPGAVRGVFELIGRRLVDRHRARTGGGIDVLTGVQLEGFEIHRMKQRGWVGGTNNARERLDFAPCCNSGNRRAFPPSASRAVFPAPSAPPNLCRRRSSAEVRPEPCAARFIRPRAVAITLPTNRPKKTGKPGSAPRGASPSPPRPSGRRRAPRPVAPRGDLAVDRSGTRHPIGLANLALRPDHFPDRPPPQIRERLHSLPATGHRVLRHP